MKQTKSHESQLDWIRFGFNSSLGVHFYRKLADLKRKEAPVRLPLSQLNVLGDISQ